MTEPDTASGPVQRDTSFPPGTGQLAKLFTGVKHAKGATAAELRRLAPACRASFATDMVGSPAYREFLDAKFIPAWRRAGLPA